MRWYLKCDVIIRIVVKYNIQNSSKDSKMQDLAKKESRTGGRWTKEEHLKFLEGLRIYGKNWKKIEQLVSTRTGSQIRSHAQKFFLKLQDPGNQEHSDLSPMHGDFHDDIDEPTLNSKMVSEMRVQQEDFSYFLTRIVEYSNTKSCFDFWAALIDSPSPTPEPSKSNKKQSFLVFSEKPLHPCNRNSPLASQN